MWVCITRPGFDGREDRPSDGEKWIHWERMAQIIGEHSNSAAQQEQPKTEPSWLIYVRAELDSARAKFPSNHLLLTAFAEEAGELIKAVLDNYQGKPSEILGEAIQTIAMVVRLLEEGDPAHKLDPVLGGVKP